MGEGREGHGEEEQGKERGWREGRQGGERGRERKERGWGRGETLRKGEGKGRGTRTPLKKSLATGLFIHQLSRRRSTNILDVLPLDHHDVGAIIAFLDIFRIEKFSEVVVFASNALMSSS